MKMTERLSTAYQNAGISITLWAERNANTLLFWFGVLLVGLGTTNLAHAQSNNVLYYEACIRLLGLVEGPFGALVTVAAGVGAIISSAVGGFKTAWTLVVVAVGAFILRAYVSLFFGGCQNGPQNQGVGGPFQGG